MNLAHPYADVIPGAQGAVLAVLTRVVRPLTIRELGRQAGISSGRATSVVDQLARAGLVHRRVAGRAILVNFNSHHLAAEGITSLMNIRGALIGGLSHEVREWQGLGGAWLYGSAARGDGGVNSDIDILLVGSGDIDAEEWAERTGRLCTRVESWTGNVVQLSEHTTDSFRQLVADNNPPIDAVREEGIELMKGSNRLISLLSRQ
ncbi:MAG: MarR family transcriptional regulator [Candidatus Dormibacteria bacterium]